MFVHTDNFNYESSILTQLEVKKAVQTWTGHEVSRRVRLPACLDNWHMKVVRLAALRTSRLNSHEYSWYSFLLEAASNQGP